MALITLATDYGDRDGYSAALIGVIKTIAPSAEVIEASNNLTTIAKTSLALWRYYAQYPKGTIHLVVVDPTVGTSRRALIGIGGGYYFVGPDNGIFSRVIEDNPQMNWYEIDQVRLPKRTISQTFHGRDIFAPAAALLARGDPPESFASKITNPIVMVVPQPVFTAGRISGEIIDIDSFGNLIINIRGENLSEKPKVAIKGHRIRFGKTFADVKPGNPVAYIGSLGLLEIAVNGKRADKYYGAKVGNKVTVSI